MPRVTPPSLPPGALTWQTSDELNRFLADVARFVSGFEALPPLALEDSDGNAHLTFDGSLLSGQSLVVSTLEITNSLTLDPTCTTTFAGGPVDITDNDLWTVSAGKTWTYTFDAGANWTVNLGSGSTWTINAADQTSLVVVNAPWEACNTLRWCYANLDLTGSAGWNNLDPGLTANKIVYRVQAANAPTVISGMVAHGDGQVVALTNVSNDQVVLEHENAASSATNRFQLPLDEDLVIYPNSGVILWWDPSAVSSPGARWRVLADSTCCGLTFEDSSGTPAYPNTLVTQIDQSLGLLLTQPAAGEARLALQAASATLPGVVTATTQTFGGDKTFAGSVDLAKYLLLDYATLDLTGATTWDNLDPALTASKVVYRTSLAANTGITGMVAHGGGQTVILTNASTFWLTLAHNSASSTATNRFYLPLHEDMILYPDASVELWYDPAASLWKVAADSTCCGIEVRYLSGTPTQNNVLTLTIDPANGLLFTVVAPGEAKLALQAATGSLNGVVTTGSQTWSGEKTFNSNIQLPTSHIGMAGDNVGGARISAGSSNIGTDVYDSLGHSYVSEAFSYNPGTGHSLWTVSAEDSSGSAGITTLTMSSGILTLQNGGSVTGTPAYAISSIAMGVSGQGQYGTDPVGNVIMGGIITTIGSTGPTLTVGTTPVSGGTPGDLLLVGSGPTLSQTNVVGGWSY